MTNKISPPDLIFCLRDFQNDALLGNDGATSYMENCLKPDLASVSAAALK